MLSPELRPEAQLGVVIEIAEVIVIGVYKWFDIEERFDE
jgi:hypothetical protein